MKLVVATITLVFTILLGGCAHPITVAPDLVKVNGLTGDSSKTSANVGYYIPADLMSLEVTTPGGGGDNVRYFPYRDIQSGYERALNNVFTSVVRLPGAPDFSRMRQQGIQYVIQPQLVTSSGSTGFFTWPPTNFTVDLTNSVRDADGKLVANPRVVGVGTAETGQRMFNHGFAGSRAMEDALSKAQAALQELKLQTSAQTQTQAQTVSASSKQADTSVEKRLTTLKDLKDKGILTQGEYERKRQEILDTL